MWRPHPPPARRIVSLTAALVGLTVLALSCGGGAEEPPGLKHDIHVHLDEWSVKVDPPSITGKAIVNIGGHNHGKYPHQITVIETDLDPAKLPISQARVDVKAIGEPVASFDVPPSDGGQGLQVVSAEMKPGRYVIFCAIPGHYQQGMYTGFEVLAAQ